MIELDAERQANGLPTAAEKRGNQAMSMGFYWIINTPDTAYIFTKHFGAMRKNDDSLFIQGTIGFIIFLD
jgi:hypothetical protein